MRDLFLIETNAVIRYTDIGISQLQETLESSDGLFWFDIEQMTDEDIAFLADFKECRFYPISIEECRGAEGRPKFNEFPEYLFLALYTLDNDTPGRTTALTKLCLFLTPDFLITVHSTPLPFLQQVKDHIEQDYLLMRSPGYCMSMILDAMVDHLESLTPSLLSDMPDVEDTANPALIRNLNRKKKEISTLERVFSTQRDITHDLITWASASLQPETVIQIRDVHHRFAHIVDILQRHRDTLVDLRDGTLVSLSMQQQRAMRRLTTVTTVFLPLMCLSVLFGISDNFLGLSPTLGFVTALVALVVLGGIIMLVTRQR